MSRLVYINICPSGASSIVVATTGCWATSDSINVSWCGTGGCLGGSPCCVGLMKRMRYHVESLHVVWWTLSKHYTYLTHRCNVFRKLNSSIINVFYTERRSSKVWRNGLHIPKLSYNPLRSVYDSRRTLVDMPGNKEITSNSLNARWSPYGIQHTTSDVNLSNRLRYVDIGNAFTYFQRQACGFLSS